jgi:hypothetical protein
VLDTYPEIVPIEVGLFVGEIDYDKMYTTDREMMQFVGIEAGNWADPDEVAAWTLTLITALEAQ